MNKLDDTLNALADGTDTYANLMAVLEDTLTSENGHEVLDLLEKAVDSGVLPRQEYLTLIKHANEFNGAFDADTLLFHNDRAMRNYAVPDGSISQFTSERPEPRKSSTIGVGTVLNRRFILDEVIGHGGMGVIYKARDIRKEEAKDKDPHIAIKVLSEGFQSHPDAFIALQREAKKAQQLAHPNIVTVYDFDRDGDTVFMTMEWLEGESLYDIIENTAPLPHQEAIAIIQGIVNGLTYAHKKGIIHLDLKPGNVFLTKHGVVKILDFGISQAAILPGQTVNDDTLFNPRLSIKALSLSYASCEIIEEEPPDPRDDIYALGCIAYELLVGRHPFNKTVSTVARDSGLRPKKSKDLPNREWKAILGALNFDRAKRTPSATQFIIDLEIGSTVKKKRISQHIFIVVSLVVVTTATSFLLVASFIEEDGSSKNIGGLINKAEKEYITGKITEPKGENALNTYKEILKIDPDNANAKQELEKIGKRLGESARRYANEKNWNKSLENIEGGIEIFPEDKELVLLRKEVIVKKELFDRQAAVDKEILELLRKAGQAFETGSLIKPSPNSAFDYYTDVLEIDPENAKAKIGIDSIKSYYLDIISKNVLKKEWDKSLEYLKPLLARFPGNNKVIALHKQVTLKKDNADKIAINNEENRRPLDKSENGTESEIKQRENKFIEIQASIKKRNANNEQTSKDQELRRLLLQAKQYLEERKFATPPNRNAYETFKQVLERDPGNTQANEGIEKLADSIAISARYHFENGNWEKSISDIETGLIINPNSEELLTLRSQVEKKIAEESQKKKTPFFPGW